MRVRHFLLLNLVFLFFTHIISAQEFYGSECMATFNDGRYKEAIICFHQWADSHISDRGIANYFIGESYYNLALDTPTQQEARNSLVQARIALESALQSDDLNAEPRNSIEGRKARYKLAWTLYRLAEINNDYKDFENAAENFNSQNVSDANPAKFMEGECYFQIALDFFYKSRTTEGTELKNDHIETSLFQIESAKKCFEELVSLENCEQYLKICASLRNEDCLLLKGKIIAGSASPNTTIETLENINFKNIGVNLSDFKASTVYSEVVKRLTLMILDESDERKNRIVDLNNELDLLTGEEFNNDKELFQGYRDFVRSMEGDAFGNLTGGRSRFLRAGSEPLAVYWLALSQFIKNHADSKSNFERFMSLVNPQNPIEKIFWEDAKYKTFLLRADELSGRDANAINNLIRELENFEPGSEIMRRNKRFSIILLKLKRGVHPGDIFTDADTSIALNKMFESVQEILKQAARVTGFERRQFITVLDSIFKVTTDNRSMQTEFYRGLTNYLEAEILDGVQNKRNGYAKTKRRLQQIINNDKFVSYKSEASYLCGRCDFSSAIHQESEKSRNDKYSDAIDIFKDLVNEEKSLRALYYIAESYKALNNCKAARRCYEKVIEKTEGHPDGKYWNTNSKDALAAIRSCDSGDEDVLNSINIDNVIFPERYITDMGTPVALELIADPDFIKNNYWRDGIEMMFAFGLQKRQIYPSIHQLSCLDYSRKYFRDLNARISEKTGKVLSSLELSVNFEGNENVTDFSGTTVTLDGLSIPIDNNKYSKDQIELQTEASIRVENLNYYSFLQKIFFDKAGTNRIHVHLIPHMEGHYEGNGVNSGVDLIDFERKDNQLLLMTEEHNPGRSLKETFNDTVYFRDYAYSKVRDRYIAVHGEENSYLIQFDKSRGRDGRFKLEYGQASAMVSPEGLDIDQKGNIYVCDWAGHQIYVFDNSGKLLNTLGEFGENISGNTGKSIKLMFPTSIDIVEAADPQKEAYIIIADRNGLHLLDKRGHFWTTLVDNEKKDKQFGSMVVTGYGKDALIHVYNKKEGKVEKYSMRILNN